MIPRFVFERIIFRPGKLQPEFVFHFNHHFEELFFHPSPGVSINAIHFKVPNPKGIILYHHGNKDNLARWGKIAQEFTRFNFDVIVMDYRGYGKSTGKLTEENLFSDALFCYSQIMEQLKPKQMVVYGRSLGTGIASWLASQVKPEKLILETPYFDMNDLFGRYVPNWLLKKSLHLRFNSNIYLKTLEVPLLLLHGDKDEVVPYSSGKKLFESILNPHKKLVTLPGGKHNNLDSFPEFWLEIEKFLA